MCFQTARVQANCATVALHPVHVIYQALSFPFGKGLDQSMPNVISVLAVPATKIGADHAVAMILSNWKR